MTSAPARPQRPERSSPEPTVGAGPGTPSTARQRERRGEIRATIVKIAVLGVVDALGVYGVIALWQDHSWGPMALMALGTVVVNVVYLRRGMLPAKYLLPGLVLLLIYQVYVVFYTGYAAFTNYGDGHNSTKSDAVAAILAANQTRVPDSPQYTLVVVRQGDRLGFLVTAPNGRVQLGTASQPLHDIADAAKDATGNAVSIPGWASLSFTDLLTQQKQVTGLAVPVSPNPADGSLRTADGQTGFLYRSTLRYDPAANRIVDTSTGKVYRDNGRGNFQSQSGATLTPGWKVTVGFANFTKVLTDRSIRGPFLGVIAWTFGYAIVTVFSQFALGLALAMLFNERRMRGQKIYRALMVLPYAFPAFMSGLIWAGLLNTDFGFINEKLLGGAHIDWLSDPWLARFSVLFVSLWLGFPYFFLLCTGALQAIPDEYIEAARIDGAGAWAILRLIKLPLLLVSLAPLLIASFAFNFNNFNVIYMLTGGGPQNLNASVDVGSTDLLITFVYKLAFGGTTRQYGFASAGSILIFIMVAAISAYSFRRTRVLEQLL